MIGCTAILLATALLAQTDAADYDAVAVRAMKDEMKRTLERLKLEDSSPPYRVVYTFSENTSWSCAASFGGLLASGVGPLVPMRSVSADVRIGDHVLDNTNFVDGYGGTGGSGQLGLPQDDDYDSIRQRLWLLTDQMYKNAVEEWARKQAWLQTNSEPDRPEDLALVPPLEHVEARHTVAVDRPRAEELVRRLSALFRAAPKLQHSVVSFDAGAGNETMISSEGTHTRKGFHFCRMIVTAATQATDGMPLGDLCAFYGRDFDDLPKSADMEAAVKALIDRLTALADAPRAEEYIGPVLFEGDAAAFAMLELLVDRLSDPQEPLGSKNDGTPFKNRLRKRITPPFLTVVDDPLQTDFEGVPLLGHFEIDDDGVKTMPVTLVGEGRLKSWYMSRIPTRAIRETNGHSIGGSGGPGNVFVTSTNALGKDELRAELLRIAAEQELPYAIRIEALARADISVRGPRASGAFRNGNVSLSAPLAAYRVYPDGHEVPIRGGEWQSVTLRSLRDIFVTGKDAHVLNTYRGGAFVSVVCPSLLIEELEMKKPAEQESLLPYLPHPFFAAK